MNSIETPKERDAKIQSEPVGYAIQVNGELVVENSFTRKAKAEEVMNRLNLKYPNDERKIVPLYV
jgi:hypothetical protein